MYATTTTGHIEHVNGAKETRVVQELIIWGTSFGSIVQDTTTEVETWEGLSYADAMTLYVSTEESTLGGVTRPRLGNAVLTSMGGAWCRAPQCWGVKVTSSYQKMGQTNMYQLTRTTTTYSVRGAGEGMTLTLE